MILLERFASTPFGVFGRLTVRGFECYTVERPWLGNRPWVSCIPAGGYGIGRKRYNRGGYDALEVEGVPERSSILIHVGNTMDDVQGCIAVGGGLGYINGKWAVIGSRVAFAALMDATSEPVDEIAICWKVP